MQDDLTPLEERFRADEEKARPRRRRLLVGCGVLSVVCLALTAIVARMLFPDPALLNPFPGDEPTGTPVATATAKVAEEPLIDVAGRIAFVDEEGNVGTVSPAGDERRHLSEDSVDFRFPAWAPEGNRLAAIGIGQSSAGIYVLEDEPEGEVRRIHFDNENAPIYLYWTHDGEQVSFITPFQFQLGLYVAPADGNAGSRLLATGQPLYWDWVRGEEQVLVHTGTPQGEARLAFFDATETTSGGANLAQPGFFQAPGVSVDGQYMAFAEVDDVEDRWLSVRHIDSGETKRTPHRGAAALGWSPVDNHVAFISAGALRNRRLPDFYGPLRLFDAESGAARVLVEDTVIAYFWAPDGQTIAYFTITEGAGERIASDRQSGRRRQSSKPARQQERLRLSLRLVDVATGQSRHLLDFRPTELFVTQFLPFFDQYALSHRLWSPDGRALVVPILDGEQARIYVVYSDGQGLQPVASGDIAFWSRR